MSSRTSPARRKAQLAATRARGRRRQSAQLRTARDALYREHVMEAAERIFAEHGFTDTRMQDIARAAGISLATLYQAYPGKSELYRAILIVRDAEMLGTVMGAGQAILQDPQNVERLLWLMEAHLRFLLEHPDYLRMQLQQGHAWYHRTAWPSREEQAMWERGLAVMQHVFAWGQSAGLFTPGEGADQARLLLALQQTRLANWVAGGMREPQAVVLGRIQADFVRQFCRPQVATTLLTDDGSGLNAAARERIRAAGTAPAS